MKHVVEYANTPALPSAMNIVSDRNGKNTFIANRIARMPNKMSFIILSSLIVNDDARCELND